MREVASAYLLLIPGWCAIVVLPRPSALVLGSFDKSKPDLHESAPHSSPVSTRRLADHRGLLCRIGGGRRCRLVWFMGDEMARRRGASGPQTIGQRREGNLPLYDGEVEALASGRELTGKWMAGPRSGSFTVMGLEGRTFVGRYDNGEWWTGARVSGAAPTLPIAFAPSYAVAISPGPAWSRILGPRPPS